MEPCVTGKELSQSNLAGKSKTIKMALLHRDTVHNELFITPIRELYDEYAMTIDEFKDKNAGIMKNRYCPW